MSSDKIDYICSNSENTQKQQNLESTHQLCKPIVGN